MAIIKIEAQYRCDGCNKPDSIELDRASKTRDGEALDDVARDFITGSLHLSIQGEHILCAECTKFIDDKFDENVLPTYDQVCAALNERAGL